MEFYINIGNRREGPFTVEELSQHGITPETEVWAQGMERWQQAGDVPELTAVLQRAEFEAAQQASRAAERQAVMGKPYNPPPPAQQPYGNAYQAPPQAPQPQGGKKRGCMPWLVAALILALLLATMVISCPDKQDHQQAVQEVVRQWVGNKVEEKVGDLIGGEGFGALLGDAIGKVIADVSAQGTDFAIAQYLEVKNYIVCSVGTIDLGDNKDKMVSVGVFGHVFTFGEEHLDVLLDEAWDEYMASGDLIPSMGSGGPATTYEFPDSVMGIEFPDEVDSIVNGMTNEVIRIAKEWAKQQIDDL